MGAINGSDFLKKINALNNEIWLDGMRVKGPLSDNSAFKGILRTKADLYDAQVSPELLHKMTYTSPTTKEHVGLSFMQPRTIEELRMRRHMIEQWARQTCGLLGRSPDYLNTVMMSFASSRYLFEGKENCFPQHMLAMYEKARDNDLSFTHTFITPQVNRSQAYFECSNEPITAKVVKKTNDGLIIKGARLLATQGGLTDEILVFSTPKLFCEPEEAFAFSIPSNSNGLRFICRESFVGGTSTFNYPLSSRFEEMDSLVVFDNVLVPWERVFFYDAPEVAATFFGASSFQPFTFHQVITRQIVKTEFMLSVAELLVQTINISEYQHIHEKLSEIIIGLETMKALLAKSEMDATVDTAGFMRPSLLPLQVASNIFPKLYPRFSEIIQLIGASGMVTLQTEKDFQSERIPDLHHYLQAANQSAEDRVKIFRLAWDLTMSAFGTRQTQYERYFFGDPVRLASYLYKSYPKDAHMEMVEKLIEIQVGKR